MGIQGLHKALEPITVDRYLSELHGLRIAVDGYVWLHRGIFSGATKLAIGGKSDSYVKYFLNRIQQLRRYVFSHMHVSSLVDTK